MTKDALEKIVTAGHVAQSQLLKIEEDEAQRKNQCFVGKAFVYDNGYNREERWPLYVLIIGIKGSRLRTLMFEVTARQAIEIKQDDYFVLTSDYHEISVSRFTKEWNAMLERVLRLAP